MAVAVPSDTPQLACVLVKATTNEAGASVIVTLASCVQVLPEIETVTVYGPSANPDICGLVCPLDQMYSYDPGGLTMAFAVPFDNPHPAMVDEIEIVKEAGTSVTDTFATFVHVVPVFVTVTL